MPQSYTSDPKFLSVAKFSLLREGPMSNAKYDPGGLTKYGIAQNVHPGVDVRNLTEDAALQIYYNEYYLEVCADLPYYGLSLALFECAVNQGVGRAKRLIQRALNTAEDGKLGPVTKRLLALASPDSEVLALFMAYRVQAYVDIKTSNPNNYQTNNKGWFKRLFLCSVAGAK